jgi:hypothetical protein
MTMNRGQVTKKISMHISSGTFFSPFNHLRRAEKDFEILSKCECANFVTGTCKAEFITSAEMSRRGMSDTYLIKGNKTKVMQDWKGFL